MNVLAKVLSGALMKIRSDRLTFDQVNRSYNIFETCKYYTSSLIFDRVIVRTLLAERNHAVLNKLVRTNLSSLFKFKHVGILFAEKAREPFNPQKHNLYSLILHDDNINSDFRLTESHVVMHTAKTGLTGLAIQEKGQLIIAR